MSACRCLHICECAAFLSDVCLLSACLPADCLFLICSLPSFCLPLVRLYVDRLFFCLHVGRFLSVCLSVILYCPSVLYLSELYLLSLSTYHTRTNKFILELWKVSRRASKFFTNRFREIRKYIEDARHGSLDEISHQNSMHCHYSILVFRPPSSPIYSAAKWVRSTLYTVYCIWEFLKTNSNYGILTQILRLCFIPSLSKKIKKKFKS